MANVIKCSSYTDTFPLKKCKVKVAVKSEGWDRNESIKTEVFTDAIYDSGFVSIDGVGFWLASNFLFHKLKRKDNFIRKI